MGDQIIQSDKRATESRENASGEYCAIIFQDDANIQCVKDGDRFKAKQKNLSTGENIAPPFHIDEKVLGRSAEFEMLIKALDRQQHDLFTREGGQDNRIKDLEKEVGHIKEYLGHIVITKKS